MGHGQAAPVRLLRQAQYKFAQDRLEAAIRWRRLDNNAPATGAGAKRRFGGASARVPGLNMSPARAGDLGNPQGAGLFVACGAGDFFG